MNDNADFEAALRETLPGRAAVEEADTQRLRASIAALPGRRRAGRGGALLAVAAGIVVVLGLGALLVSQLPIAHSGAAPQAPDPAAFASDPRLAVCGLTSKDAEAIFEMDHVRDYPLHLPAAYPLTGLQADPEAPALVIVRAGPASPDREGDSPGAGNHDICMVVGADASGWAPVTILDVDTSGPIAHLPEPTGTPFADALAPWAERCGGADARILDVYTFARGTDSATRIVLDPSAPELATDEPAAVIVYVDVQPFAPLGTPPADSATIAPREPLAPDHHDICVLVGADPATATRTIHEDVVVATVAGRASPTTESSPPATPGVLPAQLEPAVCRELRYPDARCLAIAERALADARLAWTDVAQVSITHNPQGNGVNLGGRGPGDTVTLTLTDGSQRRQDVGCPGLVAGRFDPACSDNPEVRLSSPFGDGSGYHDVPCGATPGGDPGSACATPMPDIKPSAAKRAAPLRIDSQDIPIASTGHLELDMGRATVPNGILSDARFTLADIHTRAIQTEDGIRLEVRSLDPSRPPFENIYEHGWYPGTEDVEVFLVMDVTSVTPGAMLQVRDLVVR